MPSFLKFCIRFVHGFFSILLPIVIAIQTIAIAIVFALSCSSLHLSKCKLISFVFFNEKEEWRKEVKFDNIRISKSQITLLGKNEEFGSNKIISHFWRTNTFVDWTLKFIVNEGERRVKLSITLKNLNLKEGEGYAKKNFA